jgi:hypothetical protein
MYSEKVLQFYSELLASLRSAMPDNVGLLLAGDSKNKNSSCQLVLCKLDVVAAEAYASFRAPSPFAAIGESARVRLSRSKAVGADAFSPTQLAASLSKRILQLASQVNVGKGKQLTGVLIGLDYMGPHLIIDQGKIRIPAQWLLPWNSSSDDSAAIFRDAIGQELVRLNNEARLAQERLSIANKSFREVENDYYSAITASFALGERRARAHDRLEDSIVSQEIADAQSLLEERYAPALSAFRQKRSERLSARFDLERLLKELNTICVANLYTISLESLVSGFSE